MLLYSTGLRVSELVRLRRSDLDPDRGVVRVRAGKGAKDRYTLFSARCARTTEIYTHVSNRDLARIVNPLDTI